jgi:hypothetical protein
LATEQKTLQNSIVAIVLCLRRHFGVLVMTMTATMKKMFGDSAIDV